MTTGVLQGVRVLDFSRVLAGPFATRLLADFGAQVIKVQTRRTAVGAEDNTTAFFAAWNRNKLGITLDMRRPEARALALELAAVSDVVVENFAPRVMDNWGMGYRQLRAVKPDIIMARMSAMGQTGPWRNHTAFAPTIHSLSGHTALNRGDGGGPGGLGFAHADIAAGLYGALAVLAALEKRRRTGRGRLIDLSQYEAAASLLGPTLMAAALGRADSRSADALPAAGPSNPGPEPPVSFPGAYPHILAAPYGCYPCTGTDRWCAIAVLDDGQWVRFLRVMGDPSWAQDSDRFGSASRRKTNETVLDRHVARWTKTRPAESLADELQNAGVPAGVVQTAADIARDPHLAARGVFAPLVHPLLGRMMAERSPIRFTEQDHGPWRPAPLLGEHNVYVFRTLLGLSDKTYVAYVDDGIIG